jgi:hypothetical protein
MPNLIVAYDSSTTGFECRVEGWLDSPERKHEWQQIVVAVLRYAFLSRSASLITTSPMPWSVGHEFPEPRSLRTNQSKYLVNRVDRCSSDLLAVVADSEDFQRGLLCLSVLRTVREEHLTTASLMLTTTVVDDPGADFEILILLDDSRRIRWLHPSKDPKPLAHEVRLVAKRLGWQVLQ